MITGLWPAKLPRGQAFTIHVRVSPTKKGRSLGRRATAGLLDVYWNELASSSERKQWSTAFATPARNMSFVPEERNTHVRQSSSRPPLSLPHTLSRVSLR